MKYNVKYRTPEHLWWNIDVEADNKREAIEKAKSMTTGYAYFADLVEEED